MQIITLLIRTLLQPCLIRICILTLIHRVEMSQVGWKHLGDGKTGPAEAAPPEEAETSLSPPPPRDSFYGGVAESVPTYRIPTWCTGRRMSDKEEQQRRVTGVGWRGSMELPFPTVQELFLSRWTPHTFVTISLNCCHEADISGGYGAERPGWSTVSFHKLLDPWPIDVEHNHYCAFALVPVTTVDILTYGRFFWDNLPSSLDGKNYSCFYLYPAELLQFLIHLPLPKFHEPFTDGVKFCCEGS